MPPRMLLRLVGAWAMRPTAQAATRRPCSHPCRKLLEGNLVIRALYRMVIVVVVLLSMLAGAA